MTTLQGQDGPRLLLVEDDPISRAFLLAVLESLPARVDAADTVASALTVAASAHGLWLIDANLPDGSGIDLLHSLRTRHPRPAAIAHTADGSIETRQRLLSAGFAEVMVKPLSPREVLQAVRRRLPQIDAGAADAAPADWDEAAALKALNGQRAHLDALRGLFLAELPGSRDAVASAFVQGDSAAMRGQLHRLRASCGFVGAERLGRAARVLHEAPDSAEAMAAFSQAAAALLDD